MFVFKQLFFNQSLKSFCFLPLKFLTSHCNKFRTESNASSIVYKCLGRNTLPLM